MDQTDEKLFAALGRVAEWRVSEFNAQNLANIAWAFTEMGSPSKVLLTVLAPAVRWRVDELNP